ncbi:BLUF domain-containing protein [Microbacterium testaceum]|uniref:BLUF domain-containing protein n=1 Tax=Microbacterium testaceum TaxID=2033 RepID=UPI003D745280
MAEAWISVSYSSYATQPYSEDDLQALVARSRAHNSSVGVGGILRFTSGRFFQVIEGPRAAVSTLLARIVKDVRHEHMHFSRIERTGRRQYADIPMLFDCHAGTGERYGLRGSVHPCDDNWHAGAKHG